MTDDIFTTIEINGVKMDVDLRTAKVRRHENLKVGDFVKVLRKQYSDSYKTTPGVVIGFDAFERLPTIIIAMLGDSYGSTTIEYFYFNEKTAEETEIIKGDADDRVFDEHSIVKRFHDKIEEKQLEIQKLEESLDFFKKHFGRAVVGEGAEFAND